MCIRDRSGSELRAKLQGAGVDIAGVIVSDRVQTTTKVRIFAGQSHSSKQQVIRVDYEGAPLDEEDIRNAILNRLELAFKGANAIVISDYNYGVVDGRAAGLIRNTVSVPVLVDSRFR